MFRCARQLLLLAAVLAALPLGSLGCVTDGKREDPCQAAYDGCISMALDGAALQRCLAERGLRGGAVGRGRARRSSRDGLPSRANRNRARQSIEA